MRRTKVLVLKAPINLLGDLHQGIFLLCHCQVSAYRRWPSRFLPIQVISDATQSKQLRSLDAGMVVIMQMPEDAFDCSLTLCCELC